jgi:hypothetical protein
MWCFSYERKLTVSFNDQFHKCHKILRSAHTPLNIISKVCDSDFYYTILWWMGFTVSARVQQMWRCRCESFTTFIILCKKTFLSSQSAFPIQSRTSEYNRRSDRKSFRLDHCHSSAENCLISFLNIHMRVIGVKSPWMKPHCKHFYPDRYEKCLDSLPWNHTIFICTLNHARW